MLTGNDDECKVQRYVYCSTQVCNLILNLKEWRYKHTFHITRLRVGGFIKNSRCKIVLLLHYRVLEESGIKSLLLIYIFIEESIHISLRNNKFVID